MHFLSHLSLGILALVPFSYQCTTDYDCNLNGICNTKTNSCQCDSGWTASDCGALDILPAKRNNGYNRTSENISSWGSSVFRDPKDSNLYHAFVAEFSHNCGLPLWSPYSRIIRAESHTGPAGPYQFADLVVDVFSHNSTVIWSPADQLYLLYYIGCPYQPQDVCTAVNFTCGPGDDHQGESGISVQSSKDLLYWQQHGMVFSGLTQDVVGADTTNPAPMAVCRPANLRGKSSCVHNIYLAYTGCAQNCTIEERPFLAHADNYTGPYTRVNGLTPLWNASNEDPFLWQDKRGNYHILMHDTNCTTSGPNLTRVGRHAYSPHIDGPWTKNLNTTAYTTTAQYDDGTEIVFARRERPHLIFSEDGNMKPLYFTNGVAPMTSNQSYTQVFPIRDSCA